MAGILLFQDRNADDDIVYETSSNAASALLGTIYLPRGELSASSNAKVADQSARSAIVVSRLSVSSRSNLVLNTGYGQTDIPVPTGVNHAGSTIVLELSFTFYRPLQFASIRRGDNLPPLSG